MANLSLKHIYKVYDGNVKAVNDFCMDIADKEFIVFVGPSGCGKSTTLRMIAGLEDITAGELYIDDELVNDYEPKDRNIAMVFQNYALYPHMSVYDNMAFSLKIAKMSNDQIHEKVMEAANILGITEYLDRKPKALSGGQRQRVALGRAIVRNPKVFLLDEPLSNLDAKLRAAMRTEITRLHKRLQTTFIYVTHDQVEAMTMGTRIVVMKNGFIQQIDTPQNLYKYPKNVFVAGFIGTPQMNFFDATILKEGNDVRFDLECGTSIQTVYSQVNKILVKYMNGEHKVIVGVRPDDIRLASATTEGENWAKVKAVVGVVEVLGSETLLYCNFNLNDDNDKKGAFTVKVAGECLLQPGDVIDVAINKQNMHVFDKETELSLKTRIPQENVLDAEINGSALTFASQTLTLPSAILNQVVDGKYELTVPSDAVTLGEGSCKGKIVEKEEIEGRTLYQLDVDQKTFFVYTDADGFAVGDDVCFDIDAKKIALKGEREVIALNTVNELDGSFIKIKEKNEAGKKQYNFYIDLKGIRIKSNDYVSSKLFACKGTKIFKTSLSYIFDRNAFVDFDQIGENIAEINGRIEEVYDYGKEVFAKVSLQSGDCLIAPIQSAQASGDIVLRIDLNKLSVKDKDIDIIIM